MKKLFILFVLFLVFACSKDDNSQNQGINGKVIRYNDAFNNQIAPKSTYINYVDNHQFTSYFKHDENGGIDRITQIVGDDGTELSTVISFSNDGNINTIYQQNGITGEITDKIYITHQNGITYYGTESETFEVSERSPLENIGMFANSPDDILLSNAMNQNKIVLEQLKFIVDNDLTRDSARRNASIASFIVLGIVIYIFADLYLESTVIEDISCSVDNSCRSNQRYSNRFDVNCALLFNSFVCSEIEDVLTEFEENLEYEVGICDGQICILNYHIDNSFLLPYVWSIGGFGNHDIEFFIDGTLSYWYEGFGESCDFNPNTTCESNYTIDGTNLTYTYDIYYSPLVPPRLFYWHLSFSGYYNQSTDQFHGTLIVNTNTTTDDEVNEILTYPDTVIRKE